MYQVEMKFCLMLSMAVYGVLIGYTYSFNASAGSSYLIIAFGVFIGGMGSLTGTFPLGIILPPGRTLSPGFKDLLKVVPNTTNIDKQ